MTRTRPLGEDRQAAMADAAMHLVATRGLRGLTHRAADAEAGLPPGSTSYYLPTRNALLTACVHRLVEQDIAGMAGTQHAGEHELVDLLVAMVMDLVRRRPGDLVARYELSLEASRQPELRSVIDQAGRRLRELLAERLTAEGVPDAGALAWPVAAMLDGLMFDRVAGAGATLSPDAYESAVRGSVSALLVGLKR